MYKFPFNVQTMDFWCKNSNSIKSVILNCFLPNELSTQMIELNVYNSNNKKLIVSENSRVTVIF